MLTPSQAIGLNQHKPKVEITPELAKLILAQPPGRSTKQIAIACRCSTEEVRAVYRDEKKWRGML